MDAIDSNGPEGRDDQRKPPQPTPDVYETTLLGRIDSRVLTNPRTRIILIVLLGIAFIVPVVQSINKIMEVQHSAFREEGQRRRTALGRWLPTLKLIQDETLERSPYGIGHWFPLPPTILIALQPFTAVPPSVAAGAWGILKILGVVLSVTYLIRAVRFDRFSVPLGVICMASLFSIRAVISDLQHANVNLFVLVWMAAMLGCYLRGRDFWAGIFLSLAIVTKITPALFVAYFAYKKSWRLCVTAGLGCVVWVLVAPSLYLGWGKNLALLGDWFDMLVKPFFVHGYAAGEIANQSLYGVLIRIADNIGWPEVEHMPILQAQEAGMQEMIKPAGYWRWVFRGVTAIPILGILAWQCRFCRRARLHAGVLLEFALVLLAMLLLSERTWKHHATTLPIVFLGMWLVVACVPMTDKLRNLHSIGLTIQFLLLQCTSPGIVGDRLADRLLDGGVFCWGLLLCFLHAAWLLRTLERQTESGQT